MEGEIRMVVSVIVPIYNVEKYINKCIESILNQTYSNLEIILVDDGSKDNSGNICDEYALIDDRIKVVHKKNGGVMTAWIAGIGLANGEYTTFIDSDDWVEIDMIEKFVKYVSGKNYDLVICNHLEEYDGKCVQIKEQCAIGSYDDNAIKCNIYPAIINNNSYFGRCLHLNRCCKLIKTELIRNNLNYCDTRISYGDDVNIMFPILLDCKTIYVMEDYLYHYRQNQYSIMHTFKRNMELQIEALNNALNLVNFDKRKFNFDVQIRNNFLCMVMALIRNEFRSDERKKDIVNSIIQVSKKSDVRMVVNNHTLSDLSLFDKLLIKGIIYKSRTYFYILLYAYRIKETKSRSKMIRRVSPGKALF